MKTVLSAALAASSLLLSPFSAAADHGRSHLAAEALPIIQVAGRDDEDEALAIIGALAAAALAERAARVDRSPAEEQRDTTATLAPIAALLGLALLEHATRDDRDGTGEPRGARAAPPDSTVNALPETALGRLTLEAVPTGPEWIEALASAQAPSVVLEEEPSVAIPPPPRLAEVLGSSAGPPVPLAGVEPSFSLPPPPRLGEELSDSAADDFAGVFGRAAETGATGY